MSQVPLRIVSRFKQGDSIFNKFIQSKYGDQSLKVLFEFLTFDLTLAQMITCRPYLEVGQMIV